MGGSDPLNVIVTLAALLLGGGLFLQHFRAVLRLLPFATPFLIMLLVIFASATWSAAPESSLRRGVTMASLLLFVFGTQASLGGERFMRIAVRAVLLTAALGIAEAALRPAYGFDTGDYANAIRGIYNQKNSFGMGLLSGMLALSFGALSRGTLRWTDCLIAGAFLLCVILSRSTTSLLLSLTICGITPLLLALDSRGAPRIVALIGLVLAAVSACLLLATTSMADLLELLGKDSSLTGRTEIWEAIDEAIARRPTLGYGYSAFWIDGSREVLRVWDHVAWEVISAHSGYRELMLQFGYVGLVLLATMTGITLAFSIRATWLGGWRLSAWMLLFLGTLAILNNSESVLFDVGLMTVYWMVGVLSLAQVSRRRAARPV